MSRRALITTCLATVCIAPTAANAATTHMQIVADGVGLSSNDRRTLTTATERFINREMGSTWHTPSLKITQSGVPIIITNKQAMTGWCGDGAAACHGTVDNKPVIVVGKFDPYWSLYTTHEIEETMVDPCACRQSGPRYLEVSDPVEDTYLRYRGNPTMLSDFVTPRWFAGAARGPFDVAGVLASGAPGITYGGYDPLIYGGLFNKMFRLHGARVHMISMPRHS